MVLVISRMALFFFLPKKVEGWKHPSAIKTSFSGKQKIIHQKSVGFLFFFQRCFNPILLGHVR